MEREFEITGKKIVLGVVAFVALIIAITWIAQGNDFFLYKMFAPREEQVRRETFEKSKAYNSGMAQELQAMQFEYAKADQAHKDALGSIVLHKVADYDTTQLSQDLQDFIAQLKRERTVSPASTPSSPKPTPKF